MRKTRQRQKIALLFWLPFSMLVAGLFVLAGWITGLVLIRPR
jgi:hypothetical protein